MGVRDLSAAEASIHLAQDQPFGDWAYIDAMTLRRYKYRLGMLAPDLPAAKVMLDALRCASIETTYKVIGDPVVRDAINAAVVHYKLDPQTPLTSIEEILSVATQYLAGSISACPIDRADKRLFRIGPAAYHASAWSEGRAGDLLDQRFRDIVEFNLPMLSLQTLDAHSREVLTKATKLLEALLPQLARSALNHVHLVVIAKQGPGFLSVSHPDVLGTIFLSPQILEDPWLTAEYLLHEAMHQKFIDLEHTHSLLCSGYYDGPSPTVRPLWNSPGRKKVDEWPIGRSLTVMHVYTCLAVFFDCVERKASELAKHVGSLPDYDPFVSCRRALDRAQYLRYRIGQHTDSLGCAGMSFVRWIGDLLDELDPLPPPTEWAGHLLLDRYVREADYVKERLALPEGSIDNSSNPRSFSGDELGDMIDTELATAQQILLLGGRPSLQSLTAVHGSNASSSPGDRFVLARHAVFKDLTQSAGRPYYYLGLHPDSAKECERLLEALVESSSRQVNDVLAGIRTQ